MASMLESLCSVDVYRILHLAAIFCLSVMLLKGIQLYQRRKALLTALQHFPGPPSHWLYGQAHEFYKDGFDLDTLHHWGLQYPNANPVWFGSFLAYLNITYVEYAKDLLSRTDPIDSLAYKYFIPWFDEGLLLSSKQKWFQHRQLQTIGFHYDVLKLQVKQMVDCTNVMLTLVWGDVHRWYLDLKEVTEGFQIFVLSKDHRFALVDCNEDKRKAPSVRDFEFLKVYSQDQLKEEGEESMDIYPYVSMMALDNILKFVFSYDTNCQKDSDSPFIMAVSELTSLVYDRLLWLPYYTDIIFYLSPKGDHFRRVCKISQQHTDNVIKQRKESVKNKEQRENTLQSRPVDLLDMLLEVQDENGHGLSDEDLCAEVNTFIVTGQDMAASGISWILYCMAKYPEHQKKCQEEIRRVLGNRQTLEWDDLHQIPYTTMCIYESLRLYPPVPLLPRKLNKPITFCDGRSLPEGTLVAVNIYSIHRNPDVWEDPEVFDPLRFSPENTELRHSHAYLPFAAGSRNCIGHNVAMIEMKVTVALTLNRFELSPDTTLTPIKRSLMTLKSKNGIHLRLRSTRGRKKDVQE